MALRGASPTIFVMGRPASCVPTEQANSRTKAPRAAKKPVDFWTNRENSTVELEIMPQKTWNQKRALFV